MGLTRESEAVRGVCSRLSRVTDEFGTGMLLSYLVPQIFHLLTPGNIQRCTEYNGTPKITEFVGLYTIERRESLNTSPGNKPTPMLVLLHQCDSPARY